MQELSRQEFVKIKSLGIKNNKNIKFLNLIEFDYLIRHMLGIINEINIIKQIAIRKQNNVQVLKVEANKQLLK